MTDTIKTTQFPLLPGHTLGPKDGSALPDNTLDAESIGVPDSMDNSNRSTVQAETPVTVHHEPRLESPVQIPMQEAQRQEPTPEAPNLITPAPHAKRHRDPLSERNPNPSTPIRPTSKRPAQDHEEDESSTPTPVRKKIKASRAPVVHVGRSPATSVASPVAPPVTSSYVGDEDMDDDDAL